MKKLFYALLAGVGAYAMCKCLHLTTIVPIRVFGEGLSLAAILGLGIAWLTFHNLRR